ncbi:tetratricopeptide repeat protein [uncultured Kordia sp.]|uniref:tetratricopeptide repeat protein n=1 Tax=uncultured Kordia sp. TaxID=507699 RepID=UPI00261C137D|nr:tetratricopeptide repeat protein [uncultured Kordia sp.]
MKNTLSFTICILFTIYSYSFVQSQKKQDTTDIKSFTDTELIKCIEEYLRSDQEDVTNLYINTLYERALKQLNSLNIVKSYFYYAYAEDVKGKYKDASEYIYKALGTGIELNEKDSEFLFRVYSLRGKIREQETEDSLAHKDFKTSLDISIKYNNDVGEANAIANLGKLRRKAKEYLQALAHYKTAYEIAIKTDNETTIKTDDFYEISRINIIMGVGGSYLKLKQPDSALKYIEKGIKRSRNYGDIEGVSYFYNDYGIAYELKKEYKKALEYFEKAEKIILEFKNKVRTIEVYYHIAKCHHKLDDYEKSNAFIKKAIAIINEKNENDPKSKKFIPNDYKRLLTLLIKNHGKLGNTEQLDSYINTQLIEIDEHTEKRDQYIRNELFGFLKEKSDLETLKQIVIERQENNYKLNTILRYSLLILSILIIVGSIVIYRNQQKKKARFRELNIKIAALKYEQRITIEEKTKSKKTTITSQPKKEVMITDKKVTAILESLKKFEQQEHYLDTNCNLRFVAKKVKTNATYLSKIINTDKGISFNEYITDLRMQYTLKRLQTDPLFRAYSVKSIAQEVGYKSADSFTKHFKNYTQLYPSYYIKNLKKNN